MRSSRMIVVAALAAVSAAGSGQLARLENPYMYSWLNSDYLYHPANGMRPAGPPLPVIVTVRTAAVPLESFPLWETGWMEDEIALESWMKEPFETAPAGEEIAVEPWMTAPFGINGEQFTLGSCGSND